MFVAITMFVSGGIIPSYIVVNKLGLYDSRWALIIPTAISAYNLIVARSFFESLPEELTESAHLDGANDFVILWKIIVPISKPIISVLIIFYAVGHWNEYFYPLIYLKSRELKPIQLYLRDILVANQQASTSTGGSTGVERQYLFEALKFSTIVITTLPITIIYPFFQKQISFRSLFYHIHLHFTIFKRTRKKPIRNRNSQSASFLTLLHFYIQSPFRPGTPPTMFHPQKP